MAIPEHEKCSGRTGPLWLQIFMAALGYAIISAEGAYLVWFYWSSIKEICVMWLEFIGDVWSLVAGDASVIDGTDGIGWVLERLGRVDTGDPVP